MKAHSLIALGLLAFTVSSSADLILYNQHVTKTISGGGLVEKRRITGGVIFDTDTDSVALISLDARRGRFVIQRPNDFHITTFSYGRAKDGTVLVIQGDPHGAISAKGNNRTLDLFPFGDSWRVPSAWKVTGTTVIEKDSESFVSQYSGTFSLDKKGTKDAVFWGYTFDEAIETVRQNLVNKGYTEEAN